MLPLLPVKFISPPYVAVMRFAFTGIAEVVKVHLPEPMDVPVPRLVFVVVSTKVTVPVGVPPICGVTVAVNVTGWFSTEGFGDDTTASVVVAFVTESVAEAIDELDLKSVEPL